MNKDIELQINDIEGIDLSLDVAVKKIEPPLDNLEVTPTKERQSFNHEGSYGYDNVVVQAIPDEYIIPEGVLPITENTTYDVTKYARVSASVHPAPYLQDKEITINENGIHNIIADEEYDGLNQVSVTVNAIEDLTEELNTYNTELTEQETKITDIIELLQTKAVGGSNVKYAPRYIRFTQYTGTDLTEETTNLDTSNVTDMLAMFNNCSSITTLDLSKFNTSNVTRMGSMFSYSPKLTSLDLSSFDTSNVTSMNNMFRDCTSLNSLNLSSFNTSKVTDMLSMFNGCSALTTLDLRTFDTSNVTNMGYMFNYCTALTHLDIRNFDFTNVTSYSDIFKNIPANCEIIVKDDTAKNWVLARRSDLTNVKTVEELEG